jgi:hypothetical protein
MKTSNLTFNSPVGTTPATAATIFNNMRLLQLQNSDGNLNVEVGADKNK